MRNAFLASAMVALGLLSCGGGDGVVAGISEYQATASVGDFLKVSVNHDTHMISYENLTNGQQGVVPYTVAADGTYDIQDPQGNLIRGIELPGYALVLEVAHAGPNQNTSCLALAVEKAPLSLQGQEGKAFNFMQWRVNSGGMEIGNAHMSVGSLATENFWPYGNMNGSGAFSSGTMNTDDWDLDSTGTFCILPDDEGESYIFGTPSGVLAVDTPNGNIICLEQQATKNLLPQNAGTYKAIVYEKAGASSGPNNTELGTGVVSKATIVVTANSHITVTDEDGIVMVDKDLVPVADQAHLVGAGKLQDPCHGLFNFRVTVGGEDTDVFVTFTQNAVFFSHFVPGAGSTYDYRYGVGLK